MDSAPKVAEIRSRFTQLYTPAVSDILDNKGLPFQSVSSDITPLAHGMVIAGPAFTILGGPSAERDPKQRMGPRVIDEFRAGVVACYDTQGETSTGVWGELWSIGAQQRGCVGAVVDGGIRDSSRIIEYEFPMFYKFRRPTDAVGRFTVVDYSCAATIGGVRVNPGDYVFGDFDGIVIVPAEFTLEVLEEAEGLVSREGGMRDRLRKGDAPSQVYTDYGRL